MENEHQEMKTHSMRSSMHPECSFTSIIDICVLFVYRDIMDSSLYRVCKVRVYDNISDKKRNVNITKKFMMEER